MCRFKSGLLAALSLSISCVLGSERLEERAFDVFDYIDPLIGTINGGEMISFILDVYANEIYRSCISRRNSPLW
jgi:hypothetical protein